MSMKRMILMVMVCVGVSIFGVRAEDAVMLNVSARQHESVPLLLSVIGKKNSKMRRLLPMVSDDLQSSGQFSVIQKNFKTVPSKRDFEQFAQDGIFLGIFLSADTNGALTWRLYDLQEQEMIKGGRCEKNRVLRINAHSIAQAVWPLLTGQEGPFFSRIAYCKHMQPSGKRNRASKHIVLADYDGRNAETLVQNETVNIAPRWNPPGRNPAEELPLVFYSEVTPTNTRLVYTNMEGRRSIASNFDGINMVLSFAEDGNRAVYCASRGRGSSQLYYCAPGVFKQITNNKAINFSPVLAADGITIYFCSDFKKGYPALYSYNVKTGDLQAVVDDAFCVSPAYSAKIESLAYAKRVNKVLQLFSYDITCKTHRQLTFNSGNKEECSWSPCGNYLTYGVSSSGKSRIAVLSLLTNEQRWITSEDDDCSYPAWSPIYREFPLVRR